jgi:GDP-mannose 6-dehydrogenase
MRVSVFGVGYVGCVTAACLAREGHDVIGVDVDSFKVRSIMEGRSPFFEPGLDELIREMVLERRLRATTDHSDAIHNSDIALICVGTPTDSDGSIRLDYLKHVFTNIAQDLRTLNRYFVLSLRSTVLPTALMEELIPLVEVHSLKSVEEDFGFVYNPEFLREGLALKDFHDAPWTIIGATDQRAGNVVADLYKGLNAPIIRTDLRTAALVKYFSNAFHALKVVFANEVGTLCRELGVDGGEMMSVFCQDSKLNISPKYLKPGFSFGGSCLPKDVKALVSEVGKRGLELPVLGSILHSNEIHLKRCIKVVAESGRRRIGLVGLSFKEGTDDLRESPAVELAERLIGKGFDVRIYEPTIGQGRLHGTNLSFIEKSIPHIWKLLVNNLEELSQHAEVLVVMQHLAKKDDVKHFSQMKPEQICIDLVRTLSPDEVSGEYIAMDLPLRQPQVSASTIGTV